jgi:hypothetical protein
MRLVESRDPADKRMGVAMPLFLRLSAIGITPGIKKPCPKKKNFLFSYCFS